MYNISGPQLYLCIHFYGMLTFISEYQVDSLFHENVCGTAIIPKKFQPCGIKSEQTKTEIEKLQFPYQ